MRTILTGVALSVACAPAMADPPKAAPERPAELAPGPLEPLNYFVGDWEIEATWAWGATLDARNEYRVGLNGKFLEVKTIASDDGGAPYERYHSFYTYDAAEEKFVAIGLAFDGSMSTLEHTLEVEDGLPAILIDNENPDGSRLRQTLAGIDEDSVSWKVWMVAPGSDQEQQIMDGVWRRVTGEGEDMTGAIDTTKFDGAGSAVRSFTKTAEIDADAGTVYDAWTTPAGWLGVYDRPACAANIDLAIGGEYEWLFDGAVGSNGCQVLSYIPGRMVSFSWNAPPTQPESRDKRTWVVVELEELSESRTRVTLTHLGFGDAPHWDETYDYFHGAWDSVLALMGEKLGRG